ncbi:hypothetical protein MSPP1_003641 [Malassezia sp. CBS 17886]|nr:hypothetical protein MSPP1_003641 [Malassezia sp. CBS 17886]
MSAERSAGSQTPRGASAMGVHYFTTMRTAACIGALLALVHGACAGRAKDGHRELQADAVVPVRTHSLFAPYVDGSLQNSYWDFGGDTIVDTGRYVRLTQDRRGERGWLWSRLPLEVHNFEVTVEFSVAGKSPTSHGDGFAMWLTSGHSEPGPVFGSRDYFNGLGVFFDTYPNTPHKSFFPRVMAMHNDGHTSYDAAADGESQMIASCTAQLRSAPVETRFRFTYVKDVYMEVAIQNKEWNQWLSCFKTAAVDLPEHPYLGFSASTGDVTDSHSIVSISTSSLVYNSRTPKDIEAARAKVFGIQEQTGGWFRKSAGSRNQRSSGSSFLGSIVRGFVRLVQYTLLAVALAAAAYFGYQYYLRRMREQKRTPYRSMMA